MRSASRTSGCTTSGCSAPAGEPRGRLLFPGISNLQHFRFLATVVSLVHIECLGIAVDDLPDGTVRHFLSARLRVRPFQRDGLAVGGGFKGSDPFVLFLISDRAG